MGLADAIAAQTATKGPKCSMRELFARLDAADVPALTAALADARIPSTAIARALIAEGHKATGFVVNRHRKGDCACGAR